MNQNLICIKAFRNQSCAMLWNFLFDTSRWTSILILSVSIGMTGCFQQYYNTNPMSPIDSSKIAALVSNNAKYFILHANNHAYGLTDIRVSDGWLDGKLDSIETMHAHALDPASTTKNHIEMNYKNEVREEVHIYAQPSATYASPVHIALKDLVRIDIYGEDKKHTRNSRVVGIVVLTLGVSAVLFGMFSFVYVATH